MVSPLAYYLNQSRQPQSLSAAVDSLRTRTAEQTPEHPPPDAAPIKNEEADQSISALFVSDDEDGEDSDNGSIAHEDDTLTPNISSNTDDDDNTINIRHEPSQQVTTKPAPFILLSGREIPSDLRSKLSEWYKRHGSWPKCVLKDVHRNPNVTNSGRQAKWVHHDGAPLTVEVFRLAPRHRVMIASAPGVGPFLIRSQQEGATQSGMFSLRGAACYYSGDPLNTTKQRY